MKKITPIIIVAALIAFGAFLNGGMCPENAFGATHTHPICGQTCSGHTWTTTTHSDINWTAWDGTSSFSGSYVYLTQDVTWTRSYSFTGTVYICLNGHTITCDNCDGIEVPSGASVFICDCVGGGKIVGADDWFTVWNSGRFYIYEGTIVGGIRNDGGIVNVRGGEILGNTEPAISNHGENVTVNVVGGKMSSKNHAIDNYGSGYTINISGGEITSMSTSTYNGIDGNGTTINMSGGSVTGNCAITGAILNFSGGTITGNEYAVINSECYLSGSGTITGPIAISAMEKVHACDVDGQNYYGGSTVKLIPATSFTGYSGVAVTDIPNAAVSRLFEMAADPNTGEDIWSLKYENSGMTFRGPRYKGNVVGNVYYGLYDDGELLLYGSGNSKSYTFDNYSHAPWNSYYSKIKKVTIGKNITYIGSYSFFGYPVTSVEMRADNLEIGDCCFDACTSLTDINFGSGKIIPDKKIFVDCEALTSVTVPSNVTMNGDSLSGQGSGNQMFYSCGNLKNAVVECSYVGPYMFEGCYALETVTFSNKDTVFYCIDKGNNLGSLTGHPFNAPGSGTMSLNIIAPECSQAHKLTVIGNTNKYINLSFTQIEQDTTVHTGGTATCKSIAVCTKCGLAYGDYSDHQYGQLVQKEDATCTAEGMEAYYQCSVCEKLFDSNRNEKTTEQLKIAAKGHDIKDVEWSSNENKHWKVCKTCSEKVDEEAHYGGEATCTEKAECDVCHEKYGELVNHELNKTDAKEATCTEAGNSAYWTCENCGGYFSDQNGTVEILENSWVIGIKDHDTTGAEWITDKDYHWHICKTCHQDVDKEIHDWDSGKVTKEPKAEETGVRTYSCKVCSATKDETIPATGWIEGDVSDLTEDTIADSAMDGETNLVQGVDFEIGNGEVIFAPTYTDSFIGTKTVIIKVGNTVYTIAVEGTKKEEHQHSWVHKVIRNAGYLKNGLERDVCECGVYQNDRVVPGYSTSYVKSFKLKKGKGSFTAKWKKQSKANQKLFNGYQIRYSTNPSMAGAKYITAGKSSKSKKIKGLAKKARYYVQIRTYTNGFYSGWSTKSVVTK